MSSASGIRQIGMFAFSSPNLDVPPLFPGFAQVSEEIADSVLQKHADLN